MSQEWIESKEPCVDCGNTFLRLKQRGRPPTRCNDCKVVKLQIEALENPIEINEETLYHGDKKELLGNRAHKPQGAEAQCVRCNRVFTSDSSCESHKDYLTEGVCMDPASLGMVAKDRRGIPVWTRPSDRSWN